MRVTRILPSINYIKQLIGSVLVLNVLVLPLIYSHENMQRLLQGNFTIYLGGVQVSNNNHV